MVDFLSLRERTEVRATDRAWSLLKLASSLAATA
jgi:hypothetical protein